MKVLLLAVQSIGGEKGKEGFDQGTECSVLARKRGGERK